MARVRMVTRTVDVTECEVMRVNVNTCEVKMHTVSISGKYATKADMLKAIQKGDTEELKSVNVVSYTEKEVLYGMPEIDFIRLAKVLPPRVASAETEEE